MPLLLWMYLPVSVDGHLGHSSVCFHKCDNKHPCMCAILLRGICLCNKYVGIKLLDQGEVSL